MFLESHFELGFDVCGQEVILFAFLFRLSMCFMAVRSCGYFQHFGFSAGDLYSFNHKQINNLKTLRSQNGRFVVIILIMPTSAKNNNSGTFNLRNGGGGPSDKENKKT